MLFPRHEGLSHVKPIWIEICEGNEALLVRDSKRHSRHATLDEHCVTTEEKTPRVAEHEGRTTKLTEHMEETKTKCSSQLNNQQLASNNILLDARSSSLGVWERSTTPYSCLGVFTETLIHRGFRPPRKPQWAITSTELIPNWRHYFIGRLQSKTTWGRIIGNYKVRCRQL